MAIAGCGSSSGPNPEIAGKPLRPATSRSVSDAQKARYVAEAESICSRSAREARAIRRRLPTVISHSKSPEEGITNGLVRPGIETLRLEATTLRRLQPRPSSRALEVFLGLFDPIVELGLERLRAGIAGKLDRARRLEVMIARLEDEQSASARQFGFRLCGIGFNHSLGGSG